MIKKCEVCKKKFLFNKKNFANKFCSKQCYFARNGKNLEKKCLICGKEFLVRPSHNDRKYCSKKCFEQTYNLSVKKNCLTCGKEFLVQPHLLRKERGKYCSILCRAKMQSQIYKGNGGPGWKGGLSFEPYTVDWTDTLKKSIRQRDKYTCRVCGKEPSIIVHHIDYDKKNCNPENLITLCRKCHAKTNFNRTFWINYFTVRRIYE